MARWTAAAASALALAAADCAAHPLTLAECREGGVFIRHAAMSRDAGITREFFMDRLQQDIALVQSFPPELRWFVQDDQDVRLLSAAAARVFDQPVDAEQHEARFVSECIRTVGLEP